MNLSKQSLRWGEATLHYDYDNYKSSISPKVMETWQCLSWEMETINQKIRKKKKGISKLTILPPLSRLQEGCAGLIHRCLPLFSQFNKTYYACKQCWIVILLCLFCLFIVSRPLVLYCSFRKSSNLHMYVMFGLNWIANSVAQCLDEHQWKWELSSHKPGSKDRYSEKHCEVKLQTFSYTIHILWFNACPL